MPTFRCEFLGCKVNQSDAERARRWLLDHGFTERDHEPDADLLLLASCTVTARAAQKGRHALRAALRRAPGTRVALLGCLTPEDRAFYQSFGERVTFLPSATTDEFLAELAPLAAEVAPGALQGGALVRRRTRSFIKVEDGCDLRCSFCIIPSIRGNARSRPLATILAEAQRHLDEGARELVLTGVHLGHFGRRGPTSLPELIRRLVALPGDFRVRLSSLEVSELSAELLELLVGEKKLVPHLHLPLQSGAESVLRRMRRPYTARLFRERVAALRARLEDPALSTDILVGFPGESDAEFAQTLALCRDSGFGRIHLFPFSPRAGTAAASLPDPVAPPVIARRRAALLALAEELRDAALARRLGKSGRVIVEEVAPDGARIGHDERYHRTRIEPCTAARGDAVTVTAHGFDGGLLFATTTSAA